ncbi:MAG: DegT/DnrJ/EryC1/StrS family aminotransferase [Micrococcales bacterium]|nr:DegT/DnrJ/EryC1/StrS family aminotransferase [Micrococcales bacterium]
MSQDRILLSQAHITQVEEEFVLDALRSGWVAPLGPHVDAFESEIAQRVGVAGALALSSGTAALHLGLEGLGADADSCVILPSMTFAASANAVLYTGARPVFVDSLPGDGNLDPALVEQAIEMVRSESGTVAAVMTVDLFGRCADNRAVTQIADAAGIPVIEDAAEALGARTAVGAAGSFGRAAALSFNGNKVMTTSGGGMLLSNDADLLARARYLSTQARQPVPWYEHTELGYNYRLSNVLAALGRGQLSRLDEMIARRRAARARYEEAVADIDGIRFLGSPASAAPEQAGDNYWLTSLVVDPSVHGLDADTLVAGFAARDIEARHLWKPMHLQPVFAGAQAVLSGVSADLFAHGITLPSGSSLSDTQIERVAQALTELLSVAR